MDQQRIALLTQVTKAISEDANLDTETGRIHFGTSLFTPVEPGADLTDLQKAMTKGGLDPSMFDFVQLAVQAQTPDKSEGTVPAYSPTQLAVIEKAGRYSGLHQLNLVLATPAITVTEIQNGIQANMK